MTLKVSYVNDTGRQIAHDLASSVASAATVYSEKFYVRDCEVWNSHFEWDDAALNYASAITLWASNKPNPSEDTDTDWVQMTSGHGYSGLPGGDPAGDDGKDMVDISASGALWYRWKIVSSVGAAVVQIYVVRKDRR